MKTFRIATRKSPLALWQAEHVAGLLESIGANVEIVPLVSGGDADMRPIDGTRQAGVFTKRIQQAVIDKEADIAVHSLKDLPTEVDERLVLAAVPERETVLDCLVSVEGWTLAQVPQNATIGTGSKRRAAQLLNLRPDLQIAPIRGNVQTRLAKLQTENFDAIMLAEAGILRLKMGHLARCTLPLSEMLPAPGQGALGIEVRSDDSESRDVVARVDHVDSRAAVTAERLLLAALHGGCLAPIAAFASRSDDQLGMTAAVLSQDGQQRLDEKHKVEFEPQSWQEAAGQLATHLSDMLAHRGAADLIESGRQA